MKQKSKSSSISAAQYRSLRRPSKYRSTKVKYIENGVEKTKDSKKEYRRSQFLKQLEKEGKISNLQEQVKFVLQENIIGPDKKVLERAIEYVADSVYEEKGQLIAEDVKSAITIKQRAYVIKRKLFRKRYPQYTFREFLKY